MPPAAVNRENRRVKPVVFIALARDYNAAFPASLITSLDAYEVDYRYTTLFPGLYLGPAEPTARPRLRPRPRSVSA